MDISKEFSPYNSRRYSRPWGAIITLNNDGWQYVFKGVWLGDENEGGDLVIHDVTENTIVAFGQKDNRKPKNSENEWYAVQADGSLLPVTKQEARKLINSK